MSDHPAADPEAVWLPLSQDEALVLFELLNRLVEDKNGVDLMPFVEHDAELWTLLRVFGLLESRLVEPFRPEYDALVLSARARLVEQCGQWPA